MSSMVSSPYAQPGSPIASAKRTPTRNSNFNTHNNNDTFSSPKFNTAKDSTNTSSKISSSGTMFNYLATLTAGLFSPKGKPGALDDDDDDDNSNNNTDTNTTSNDKVLKKRSDTDDSSSKATESTADDSLESETNDTSNDDEEPYDDDVFNPYLYMANLPPINSIARHRGQLPAIGGGNKFTLVLDLDETLVHCSIEPMAKPDIVFPVNFNGVGYQIYARKRPYLEYFLNQISTSMNFEVVVFTASQSIYADKLLDFLDPQRTMIKHRLFRESCVCVQGNYVKELNVLGRDLRTSVLVDNSPHAYAYNIENGIPIESWFEDETDTELLKLLGFLRKFNDIEDVRPLVTSHFKTYKLIKDAVAGKRPPAVSPPF